MSKIDDIRRLKELLDQGAITTEEYNELKKKIIGGQTQIPLEESKATINSLSTAKRRPSLLIKTFIIGTFVVVTAMVVLGIKNLESIKEAIASVLQKPEEEKKDVAYEGRKKIGRIVKMEIMSDLPHSGAGIHPINVPTGKMWTPLYYEFISGSAGRKGFNIYIYPERRGDSYLNASAFEFYVGKKDFVSYKFSKQNFRSIAGQGNQGIIIVSWSQPSIFEVYFLEEELN